MTPKRCLLLLIFIATPVIAHAVQPAPTDPLRFVLIDQKTEAELGPFPYDRSKIAQAITICHAAGAKGVVLKYFIDQPKSQHGDDALAA